ncbi:MAG: CBS domain-containing protein [Nitrospirae bacterium]|nr:CBS domain-containing protein [Nitrospirota bacterium]
MEIITTHTNADFDAVAAMVAAKRLYPEARLIFPGTQERNVRTFLAQHNIAFDKIKDVSLDQVTRLIIVDCKNAGRIGNLSEVLKNKGISLHIYDHHPAAPGDLRGEVEVIEEVGATTTLFVEQLKEKNIPVSQTEAALFAIAIYEETGSLTFPSTTPRDVTAVAHLLSCGLDLRTVSRYLIHEMDADQIALLDDLIHHARTYYIDSLKIVIAKGETERYISELSTITHKVRDMENIDVLIVLVRMEDKIQLVARSRLPEVDVGEIAREFGGGGHPTAASASIKDLTTIQVEERILESLNQRIKPFKTAKDIMTTPVKTAPQDVTVSVAGDLMTRYGVNVLPVIDGEQLTGLITREIIQKAIFHKFGHLPITDIMSTEFHTVAGETPFREIESLMIEHNQRFIPVVEGDRVVGAITRTDLLRALHEDVRREWGVTAGREGKRPHERNLRSLLRERLPGRIEKLLQDIGVAADETGVAAFAVGGFVRDLLLGVENYDVDIVIEGNGIAFAENFAAAAGARVRSHQRFGTAVIIFPDGFKMDVATARTEYYEYPTALPTVELSSIKKDLYRRDFTINTLAIKVNKKDFGYLIDFFGGQRDLKEKTVRVLHNLSFIEDPTRIYRAIRFEQRLGFKIARHTQNLIRGATKIDLFHRLAGRRLFTELVLLMSEEDPAKPVSRLAEFDLLRFIHPSLQWDDETAALFQGVKDALAWYRLLFLGKRYEPWQVYFFALIDRLSLKATGDMCERLAIREKLLEKVISMKKETPLLLQGLSLQGLFKMRSVKPSRLYGLLKGHPQETLLYLMAKADKDEAKRGISLYLSHLQDTRLSITGRDLAQLGVKPGPLYGKIMGQILWAKLDGLVKTREEEMEFAKGILGK